MNAVPAWQQELTPTDDSRVIELRQEIDKQDRMHPAGYPGETQDGPFLGIQRAVFELDREAMESWYWGRCKCETPGCGEHDWSAVRVEVLQAAAICMRIIRGIDRAAAARPAE